MTSKIGPREQALREQREARIVAQKPHAANRAEKAADAFSVAGRVKARRKPKKRKAKRPAKAARG